jgi:hypothetical protein
MAMLADTAKTRPTNNLTMLEPEFEDLKDGLCLVLQAE